MEDKYFDLTDPYQKKISERLQKYMNCGFEHDFVLKLIGRDFPYIDKDNLSRSISL